MLTREEAVELLDGCDGEITLCGSDAHRIKHLLNQHREQIYPSDKWAAPTVDEIKELSRHGNHCKHATSICERCYRHAVAYWMEKSTKQPRRKLINTNALHIADSNDVVILQTFDTGEVYTATFNIHDLSGQSWELLPTKLPPIPQDDDNGK